MRAAAIDIGSNSIKLLVAERGAAGITEVLSRVVEARIGGGIGSGKPVLGEEGMSRGIAAAESLAADAKRAGAEKLSIVATSAVRDAANGSDFRARVAQATGVEPRILSGEDEAGLIALGLSTDPALGGSGSFDAFDLGGGSLECIQFRQGRLEHAVSLPLGCVRLTERFAGPVSAPFSGGAREAVSRHVREVLGGSGFPLPVGRESVAVGSGGTLTTVRAIEARRLGIAFEASSPAVTVEVLSSILAACGALGLEARKAIPGLPGERADVLPAGIATLLAVAEAGEFPSFRHSLRNLRWGVAAQLLGGA